MIIAEVEEKEKAKEKYGDMVSGGNTAYYASYDEDGNEDRMIFYIGNLLPAAKVRLHFSYVTLLQTENGCIEACDSMCFDSQVHSEFIGK